MTPRSALIGAAIFAGTAGIAVAADIKVTSDIAVSTTWTANNTYNLQKQIYVLPGATLTIEAGTVIASDTNIGGSLAVTRGAQIIVKGTEKKPVIMTSKADVATWTNGDPRTGTWREAANEWGNLTLMGRAYISEDEVKTNKATCDAGNIAPMEGLIAAKPNDPNVLYGGGNDDDDSGSISYHSIRYGGKVVALNKELNGLSLGGIGRATEIDHVEIMNNVDDGIEIWGGTVNLRYVSIWNIGDDSLDVDQGWRGRAQFGLIVQGYSLDAKQGSGVGDNACETDGAEQSDYQPRTRATVANFTIIGQPKDGDGLTAWRDNAGVQYLNCIFMDCGEKVVRFDNVDGDGGKGYGFNGTRTWAQHWTTNASNLPNVNACSNPGAIYKSQVGNVPICAIRDSVFFRNTNAAAYTEADARGVFAAGNNNDKQEGRRAQSPITSITRAAAVTKGGKVMEQVIGLDPRPANTALTSVGTAPADGFFSQAKYRGGFAPGNNWLVGWTAASAFGYTSKGPWTDLGEALRGTSGDPVLAGSGPLTENSTTTLKLTNAAKNAPTLLVLGLSRIDAPLFGGTLVPNFAVGGVFVNVTNGTGETTVSLPWPKFPQGTCFYWQNWTLDAAAPQGFSASNAIVGRQP